MTPVAQFLLQLLAVRSSNPPRAEDLTERQWEALGQLAIRGGLAGLVAARLRDIAAPNALLRRLALAALRVEQRNRLLTAEYDALQAAALDRDLPLVPLKGVALLPTLYDDLSQRSMVDVDVLAAREHIADFDVVMKQLGYSTVGDLRQRRAHSHHLTYLKQAGRDPVHVELHWTPFMMMYVQPVEDRRAWRQALRSSGPPELAPTDLMLSLLLHFAAHRYRSQLKWLVDIARLAAERPMAIDWDTLWQSARRLGARRAAAFAAWQAKRLLGAPIPTIAAHSAELALLERLCSSQSLVESAAQPNWLESSLINLLTFDSPLCGLRFVSRKGTEVMERYTPIRLPQAWLRDSLKEC